MAFAPVTGGRHLESPVTLVSEEQQRRLAGVKTEAAVAPTAV